MKPTNFAYLLTRYLGQYLPGQRNLSGQTIASYRDTFKLLLRFCQTEQGWAAEQITLASLDRACLEGFLDWLESTRHCRVTTRNQRLAALRAFFRWVSYEAPEQLESTQRILGIPWKKTHPPMMAYLTPDALKILLAQPGQATPSSRRDTVLLAFLYDTAARVQELADVVVRDIRLESPAIVTLTGKGSKSRQVPLMTATATLVAAYLEEQHLTRPEFRDHPLFYNRQRRPLSRWGIAYLLQKYMAQARAHASVGFPETVSPHTLRHTKAMHLLQAGVNLIYIRDLLGHSDVSTTEIYARADAEMTRQALERARIPGVEVEATAWTEDANLMQWLKNLGEPSF